MLRKYNRPQSVTNRYLRLGAYVSLMANIGLFIWSCNRESPKRSKDFDANREEILGDGSNDAASNADDVSREDTATDSSDRDAEGEAGYDGGDGGVSICGNAIVEPGEDCDGPVPNTLCEETLGAFWGGGCTPDCRFEICYIDSPASDGGGYGFPD